MKQQTAVEWLQELYNNRPDWEQFILMEEFEIAKEMEKEDIKQGYIMALLDQDNKVKRDAEDYYNQTYNNGND